MDTISAIWLDALVMLVVTPVPLLAASIRLRRSCAEKRRLEARIHAALAQGDDALARLVSDGQGRAGWNGPAPRRAQAMAERTRSGYVYVISNNGSFGSDVVKIGLSRRLDPAERVRELGDASVPFDFDVHAMIYSDDAPALERALHSEFHRLRVNRQNDRKEFFRTGLDDVERAVRRLEPAAVFFRDIEAREFLELRSRRRQALLARAGKGRRLYPALT
ncbi:GIY-YIG nuclease family protein [Kaistia granuli]|uniref:GIY-YIG nuclease family protein n=1 Tax=Kaistia granuli TaxID=363259 RepID=UPI0003797C48|nr:GIY-YIG nuclease family protein [Kaistia granuli]